MNKKTGRNEPCPCGSGKKYKKCCGLSQPQGGFIAESNLDDWFPASERTVTLWDEYMELIPAIAMYGNKIEKFDSDGKEFKKAVSSFEKQYRPGEVFGIMDSIFMSWMYFDLRFGNSHETVAERLLADPMMEELSDPGPTFIRQLSESYLTFFEIIAATSDPDAVTVEELGTGERFTVFHVKKLIEIAPVPGEIWYVRRVGSPDQSVFYTTPYIYKASTRAQFERAVKIQEQDFRESSSASLFSPDRYFAEGQKMSVPFWTYYILKGGEAGLDHDPDDEFEDDFEDDEDFQILFNTDGEEILFHEIHFRIQDEAGLRKRLSMLRSYEYDKAADAWTWLKPKSRKYPDKPRNLLGYFRIEDGRLIAETNSRERASRMRSKLKKQMGDLIAYEKTQYFDPEDLPEMDPEEIEARKKASEELNSHPEIQAEIKKHLENYYFVEWPNTKLPSLGELTPRQAATSDKERSKLIALIDGIDQLQDTHAHHMPKIDFDKLRVILGIPPKKN